LFPLLALRACGFSESGSLRFSLLTGIALWGKVELLLTFVTAEVVSLARMLTLPCGLVWLHVHSTNRIF
jgi:hypothetical protein